MDELLRNYIKHVDNNISPILAKELNEILNKNLERDVPVEEIESLLKEHFIKYLLGSHSKDFDYTSRRLYEAYVEYDDNNLLKAVRFLTRIYGKFLNLHLARYFCDWRIKAKLLKNSVNKININNEIYNNYNKIKEINRNTGRENSVISDSSKEKILNNSIQQKNPSQNNEITINKRINSMFTKKNEEKELKNVPQDDQKDNKKNQKIYLSNKKIHSGININSSFSNISESPAKLNFERKKLKSEQYLNSPIETENNQKINDEKNNSIRKSKDTSKYNSLNIFDKLYLDSYKKNDEKLLNEEIKKLSGLDECTFQPNMKKLN